MVGCKGGGEGGARVAVGCGTGGRVGGGPGDTCYWGEREKIGGKEGEGRVIIPGMYRHAPIEGYGVSLSGRLLRGRWKRGQSPGRACGTAGRNPLSPRRGRLHFMAGKDGVPSRRRFSTAYLSSCVMRREPWSTQTCDRT